MMLVPGWGDGYGTSRRARSTRSNFWAPMARKPVPLNSLFWGLATTLFTENWTGLPLGKSFVPVRVYNVVGVLVSKYHHGVTPGRSTSKLVVVMRLRLRRA